MGRRSTSRRRRAWCSPAHKSNCRGASIDGMAGYPTHWLICAQVHAVSDKGEKRWSTDLGHPVMAEPVLDGEGTLYVGNDDGKVYALDARKGKILWSHAVWKSTSGLGYPHRVDGVGRLKFDFHTGRTTSATRSGASPPSRAAACTSRRSTPTRSSTASVEAVHRTTRPPPKARTRMKGRPSGPS